MANPCVCLANDVRRRLVSCSRGETDGANIPLLLALPSRAARLEHDCSILLAHASCNVATSANRVAHRLPHFDSVRALSVAARNPRPCRLALLLPPLVLVLDLAFSSREGLNAPPAVGLRSVLDHRLCSSLLLLLVSSP